jgi:hypothetical protein
LHLILQKISDATKNVYNLLSLKIEGPPVFVDSIKKHDESDVADLSEENIQNFEITKKKVKVYEIWKVFFEENLDERNFAYVVISADNISEGYKEGEWSNLRYRGVYSTLEEAKNQISGYLR